MSPIINNRFASPPRTPLFPSPRSRIVSPPRNTGSTPQSYSSPNLLSPIVLPKSSMVSSPVQKPTEKLGDSDSAADKGLSSDD